jgi:hypothetical protein
MRKTILTSSIVLFSFAISPISNAQSMKFPSNDTPNKVAPAVAAAKANDQVETSGFTSAYFQKSDLNELIDVKGCVGIRFYVAMEDPKQKFADVIGVAINETGKEIGDFLSRKYHLAKPLDAHYPQEFKKMDRSNAKRCVDNLKNGVGKVEPFAGYLGTASILKLVEEGGASGIRIYAAIVTKGSTSYRTMSFGSVSVNGKLINNVGTDYLESNLPCPVDCGDEVYLWQR